MSAAVYGVHQPYSTTMTLVSDNALRDSSQLDEQQYITTFFCRALYDYQSADDSSLSFRRGDVIEVLTRLETGWWDGLLGDERGWFPSNYVVVISDEEADATLSASDYQQDEQQQQQQQQQPQPQQQQQQQKALISQDMDIIIPLSQGTSTVSSLVASSEAALSRLDPQNDHGNWLENDTEFDPGHDHFDDFVPATVNHATQSSDFWVPQVTADGQVSPHKPCPKYLILYLTHD